MGEFPKARTVVEFGVGTGVYTEEILKRLHPDAVFLAFEIDPDLASAVDARLQDPRVRVINDSAENAEAYLQGAKADIIVSSIPFTSLPASVRQSLLGAAHRALAPDGQMLVLQYSTTVLPDLKRFFSPIRRRLSPINIPPAFLFACSIAEAPFGADEEEASGETGRWPYVFVPLALGTLLLLGRRLVRRRRSSRDAGLH
jgi:phospholipid N-methyltransferase